MIQSIYKDLGYIFNLIAQVVRRVTLMNTNYAIEIVNTENSLLLLALDQRNGNTTGYRISSFDLSMPISTNDLAAKISIDICTELNNKRLGGS